MTFQYIFSEEKERNSFRDQGKKQKAPMKKEREKILKLKEFFEKQLSIKSQIKLAGSQSLWLQSSKYPPSSFK